MFSAVRFLTREGLFTTLWKCWICSGQRMMEPTQFLFCWRICTGQRRNFQMRKISWFCRTCSQWWYSVLRRTCATIPRPESLLQMMLMSKPNTMARTKSHKTRTSPTNQWKFKFLCSLSCFVGLLDVDRVWVCLHDLMSALPTLSLSAPPSPPVLAPSPLFSPWSAFAF